MQCPKCKTQNSDTAHFCLRCHTPLRFVCPACKHQQDHGGQCDKCGVDFAKYMAALMFQAQAQAAKEREKVQRRAGFFRELVWVPITGGLSLLRFLFKGRD